MDNEAGEVLFPTAECTASAFNILEPECITLWGWGGESIHVGITILIL